MKKLIFVLSALVVGVPAMGTAQVQSGGADLAWAYPVPDKTPPPGSAEAGPKKLPGSSKSYTQKQIDDTFAPPDWYPQEHAALPPVVEHGVQAQACGSCHLMSGLGHPESAYLAGLPVEYMLRQMADFKAGLRKDAKGHEDSLRASRMNIISSGLPEEEMHKAIEWFAALKPAVWYKVVETKEVPKTWVNAGRMRLPLPGGGTEALGNRIITLPQDPERVEERDPHSGFIAYVPVGSMKRGEELVKKGGSGKTIACETCHGEGLKGLGDVPRIAGIHPSYVMRQLYDIQTGANTSSAAAQMKKVVEKLNENDMIDIAAYTASLMP